MSKFSYASNKTPRGYKCHKCGAKNCKLWREYQCFGEILLDCVDCAVKSQNNPKVSPSFHRNASREGFLVEEDGMYVDEHGQRCDQIGWRVPAVPTEDLYTYWGYTSVPQEGVDWWKNLPLRQPRKIKK